MGQAFPKRYLMHKARNLINSFLGVIGPFLETSDVAGMGQSERHGLVLKLQNPKAAHFCFL